MMIIVDETGPYISCQPLESNKKVQTCQARTIDDEPILYFWQQFVRPSTPWHTDITQCKGKFQQIKHLICIIYSPS